MIDELRKEISFLLGAGVYSPNELFNRIYPYAKIHASRLRDLIAEIKNGY